MIVVVALSIALLVTLLVALGVTVSMLRDLDRLEDRR